ncbi:MAG: M48 family metalloprotease [Parvibaculum sp.]|uniref:M48 family metalloprotease n=1 Tax=Parvibaculum sp. TaxID=2024848 RepID=UPI002722178D|nr:M48 family metalloprotease [Parvibaculum sp.]MDO8840668.1 M48 family metalloprotease [Parvibaculum sp.]
MKNEMTGRGGQAARATWIVPVLATLLFSVSACTTNPATGKRQVAPLVSVEQESKIGAEAHPKILEAFGGAYPDARLGGYVAGIATRVARATNVPNGQYRVTVLDSPVINAFALPGGYVYVTRGLVALANDEAELAGVIGHEMGHVAARHSAQRQTAAMGTTLLGAVLGAVIGNQAASQAIGLGGQGFLAGYSRDQEFESDMLGVRYLTSAGYDAYGVADFLTTMGAQDALEARLRNVPDAARSNWLASHPATAARVDAARSAARDAGAAPGKGERNRETYLKALNGILYGDRSEDGIVRDRDFVHPKLGFAFKAPTGFAITNSPAAVLLQGPDRTVAKFDTGQKDASVDIARYLTNQWARDTPLSGLQKFKVNGMNAATATTRINDYNARLVAIEFAPDRVYRFLTGTLPQTGTRHDAALQGLVMSFRKISPAEAAAVKPLRLRVVTVRPGDTAASLGRRMVYSDFQAERFRVLNGLGAGDEPRPGTLVKLVTE